MVVIADSARPFETTATTYRDAGLAVIPCGGDDGKRPRVQYAQFFKKLPPASLIAKWAHDKFACDNVGIVTGEVSNLTVIDCDAPDLVEEVKRRFGSTPVVIGTPRGGKHFWYRYDDERSATRLDGLKIDIRAEKGLCISPPSLHPQSRQAYEFLSGGIEKLGSLPTVKPGSLPKVRTVARLGSDKIAEGIRNDTLFRIARRDARNYETVNELRLCLEVHNEASCDPPLPHDEIRKIAESVWRYKQEGRLFVSGHQSTIITLPEFQLLVDRPSALELWLFLKLHHFDLRDEFILSLRAMVPTIGLSETCLRRARNTLESRGFIRCVHKGGKGSGDTDTYAFTQLNLTRIAINSSIDSIPSRKGEGC